MSRIVGRDWMRRRRCEPTMDDTLVGVRGHNPVVGPTGGRRHICRGRSCAEPSAPPPPPPPPRRGREGTSGDLACRCQAVNMLGPASWTWSWRGGRGSDRGNMALHAGFEQAELPGGILAGRGWGADTSRGQSNTGKRRDAVAISSI